MEYHSAIKKNEILPFATTWVDLEGIMLSKISQSKKDKYHMMKDKYSYVEFKKQNRQAKEKETSKKTLNYRAQMVTRGEGSGEMGEIGEGD